MALTSSEVRRIKYELGYGLLSVAAEPYVSYVSLFDQIIQPYLTAGAATRSSTAVAAADTPTPATLTLVSATGISAGDRVVIDVDSRQESATIQALSGTSMTVLLTNEHSGFYPVEVEGGVSMVRAILRKLQAISGLGASASFDAISQALATAGIKKMDEIEFFGDVPSSQTRIGQVKALQNYWRDELASVLGIVRLNGGGGGATVSMY